MCHVGITVSDLDDAMEFFRPFLEFLGYEIWDEIRNPNGQRLRVTVNHGNGAVLNLWEAKPEFARHPFEVYEVGLHHIAFYTDTHEQVDQACELAKRLGAKVLDGPWRVPVRSGRLVCGVFSRTGWTQVRGSPSAISREEVCGDDAYRRASDETLTSFSIGDPGSVLHRRQHRAPIVCCSLKRSKLVHLPNDLMGLIEGRSSWAIGVGIRYNRAEDSIRISSADYARTIQFHQILGIMASVSS